MNNRYVTWSTVVQQVNGRQIQVELTVDLEEMARNYVLKADASAKKQIKPCSGAATVKILGYPTNPNLRK